MDQVEATIMAMMTVMMCRHGDGDTDSDDADEDTWRSMALHFFCSEWTIRSGDGSE